MHVEYRVWILRLFVLLAFSVLLRAEQLPANVPQFSERLVVLENVNSPISRAVSDDYVKRRGVRHTLSIACH